MSLSILNLLPSLYNVQKILEDNTVSYGSMIYLNPKDDASSFTNRPSKAKNIESLTSIADNLVQFSTSMNGIQSRNFGQSASSWFITCSFIFLLTTSIFTSLVVLGLCMNITKVQEFVKKIFKGDFISSFASFSYPAILSLVILVLILGLLLQIVITLGVSKVKMINNLNNVSPILTNNIAKAKSMFDASIDQNDITLNSNSPAMVWYWSQAHPSMNVNWQNDANCDQITDVQNADITPNADVTFLNSCKTTGSESTDYFKKMYPFVSTSTSQPPDIDPFVMKKEIQSFDLYGQLSRIKACIAYLNELLLQQNDDVYGGPPATFTNSQVSALQGQIAQIILSGGVSAATVATVGDAGHAQVATGTNNTNITTTHVPVPAQSLATLITNNRNQIVAQITDIVILTDPTNTFIVSNDDLLSITNMVSKKVNSTEFGILNGPLNDLLTEIPLSINNARNKTNVDPTQDYMKKYIPVDRFLQKVGSMTGSQFITNLVFYVEELRSASEGINRMNQQYDVVSIKIDTYASISNAVVGWMLVIFIVLWIIVICVLFGFNRGGKESDGAARGGGQTNTLEKVFNEHADHVLFMVVISCALIIVYTMLWSYVQKQNALKQFNYQTMVTNGQLVVTASENMMNTLHDDMVNNMYGITIAQTKVGSNDKINDKINGITIDPYISTESDVSIDKEFQHMVQITNMSNNVILSLNSKNNLAGVYDKCIQVIEAYNKCNSLFTLNDTSLQFPIVEVTSYALILLIVMIVIGLVCVQFNPLELYEKFVWYKKINNNIHADDLDVNKFEREKEKAEKENKTSGTTGGQRGGGEGIINITKYIGCVVIVFILVLFVSAINSNANSYMSGLYANMLGGAQCQ